MYMHKYSSLVHSVSGEDSDSGSSYITKHRSGEISLVSQKSANKGKMKEDMYKMIKRYYYHKTARDLNKTIFVMQGNYYGVVIMLIFILHRS